MIIDKKNTGSYYTPQYLAEFISKRLLNHFENRTRISILEPSVGDGAFLESIKKHKGLSINITALDINSDELMKAQEKWTSKGTFINKDFLEYIPKRKFSAVIGNPPYIKKNRLKEKQIEFSKSIHNEQKLSEKSVKNIWTTFLVKSITHLTKDGVLAFILPSELLQVSYTKEIRGYLKNQFEKIEIFTFNDLMFECKGQDTIVLFAYKKAKEKGDFFTNINSISQLENNNFALKENLSLIENNSKWTHHFLSSKELIFIYNLKNRINNIGYYIESKPGIVTAANKFFIIDKKTEKEYSLSDYTIPIIQKGLFVNGSVVFDNEDYLEIETSNLPSKLLRLKKDVRISKKLNDYLTEGEKLEIPTRYKCRIRDKWYVIPNIAKKPEAFFFKRSHNYPKLLKNNSEAFVTDSAYKVEMKNNFDLNSFIYSFYNSLTLLFAEIEGRYYGGGVLELVPSEFKKLPIPYCEIDDNEFSAFTTKFENKSSIDEILAENDLRILNLTLGLNKNEIKKIEKIRLKLIEKRMGKKPTHKPYTFAIGSMPTAQTKNCKRV